MLTKSELYQLYHGDDLTTTQIGERCGVTATTIQNWLRGFGIKSKPRHQIARSLEQRFSESYAVDENGCWIWTKGYAGGKKGRYGMLRLPDGSAISAHRLSYTLHHGDLLLQGMVVCHKCDVTGCVNPDHLFLGTPKDNTQDMLTKGRGHPPRKLTDADVIAIRESDAPSRELAERFSIDRTHIWRIKTHRSNAATTRAQMQLR